MRKVEYTDDHIRHLLYCRAILSDEDSCWIWLGPPDRYGYGRIQVDGKTERAHRMSYRVHVGEIPPGMNICHTCDTPACINPHHLFPGTQADNIADKIAKGRGRSLKGDECRNAILSERDVQDVFAEKARGDRVESIAAARGVSTSTVYKILQGHSWKHITKGYINDR